MDARWGEGRGRRARRGINCTAVPLRATNQCSVVETARGRGKARASGAAGARARPGREERDEETSEDVSARRWSAFAPRVGSRARGYGRSLAPAGDIVVESRTHRGEDGGGSEAGEGGLAELLDLLDDGGLGGGGLDGLTVTSGGEGKVVVSSRSGYPMRVMVGVVVHPWHPDTTNAKPISLGDARERPRRARLRAQKTSGDSACASPRSRARSTSHRASRDEPEPRANPVGAIKTPHRSSERIAKTKIPRWGLPPVLTACWCGPRRRARRRWWRRCKPSFLLELRKVVRCVCKYDAGGGATIGVCPSPASPTKLCQLTGEYASTNQKARRADFHGSVLNLCILPDFRRARWHVESKNPYEAHRLDKIWTRAHAQHRLAQRLAPALDGAARQTAGTRVRPEDGAATDRSGTHNVLELVGLD